MCFATLLGLGLDLILDHLSPLGLGYHLLHVRVWHTANSLMVHLFALTSTRRAELARILLLI